MWALEERACVVWESVEEVMLACEKTIEKRYRKIKKR